MFGEHYADSFQADKVALLAESMANNALVRDAYSEFLVTERAHKPNWQWDGYIHPSSLDWTKTPEQQFEAIRRNYTIPVEGLRRMSVGTVLHDHIQDVMSQYLFVPGVPTAELGIESYPHRFRGTPDQYGATKFGKNVLLEYKSISSYQVAKDSVVKRLEKSLDAAHPDRDEILKRVKQAYIDYTKPMENHLCQAFTYAVMLWVVKKITIDTVGIVYLRKETLGTIEFYYNLEEHTDLLEKAAQNYRNVLECVRVHESQQHLKAS